MRIAILGNSGSGKSTLACALAASYLLPRLDLDTVAWTSDRVAVARAAVDAANEVRRFCETHEDWVVEGCYAGLVAAALVYSPILLFLEPGVDVCLNNCRNRPWEPHKYPSRRDQDEKLNFLLDWVREYYSRAEDMSLVSHVELYEKFHGYKYKFMRNIDDDLAVLSPLIPLPAGSGRLPTPPGDLACGAVTLRFIRVVTGEPPRGFVPFYHFLIEVAGTTVGHINFRVGDTEHVRTAAGHIGYEVLEPHRGHGYALAACRAVGPFVRVIYDGITVTCDPDNLASIRTLDQLGARLIDEVAVPRHDPHYARGSRTKLRYRWVP